MGFHRDSPLIHPLQGIATSLGSQLALGLSKPQYMALAWDIHLGIRHFFHNADNPYDTCTGYLRRIYADLNMGRLSPPPTLPLELSPKKRSAAPSGSHSNPGGGTQGGHPGSRPLG